MGSVESPKPSASRSSGSAPRSGRPRPGRWIAWLLVAAALCYGAALFVALTAECSWCLATFCGNDAECPSGCGCFIPWGEATGHCG